jgi:hypothetical protein
VRLVYALAGNSGRPTSRMALAAVSAISGAKPTAADQPLMVNLGSSANSRAPATFASSSRPSFASGAQSHLLDRVLGHQPSGLRQCMADHCHCQRRRRQ